MSKGDYKARMYVARQLRAGVADYDKRRMETGCDKFGFGFNKDNRFSAASFQLSIDSWAGYYGNSSCGQILHIHDEIVFRDAFLAVLNNRRDELLLATAEYIEKNSEKERQEHIAKLKAELAEAEDAESFQPQDAQ